MRWPWSRKPVSRAWLAGVCADPTGSPRWGHTWVLSRHWRGDERIDAPGRRSLQCRWCMVQHFRDLLPEAVDAERALADLARLRARLGPGR